MLVGGSNIQTRSIPFVTIALIILNVAAFIKCYTLECQASREFQHNMFGIVSGYADESAYEKQDVYEDFLHDWGFSMPDLTDRSDFASMFTYMFIHIGIFHILGNMVMLWAFGVAMEEALGPAVYGMLFAVCGLAAGLGQGLCDMSSDMPTVGASGAVAGVMGAFFVLFGAKAKLKLIVFIGFVPRVVTISAAVFGAIWVGQQFLHMGLNGPTGGGVAWMAHVAGCGVGAGLALMLRSDLKCEIETADDGCVVLKKETETKLTEHEILEQVLELQPVNVVVDHLIGEGAEVNCTQCNALLNLEQTMGDRLVLCSGCGKATYVDAELLLKGRDLSALNF